MKPTNSHERVRVRVNYVPRGYGLALTIREDTCAEAEADDFVESADDHIHTDDHDQGAGINREECLETNSADSAEEIVDDADDGYLTVVQCGVTTLELRRPDGESSYLIWDQSEVDWDSILAG